MREARRGIVCAGNWLVDHIHFLDRWPGESELCRIGRLEHALGGGGANVAFDLAAFGVDYPVLPLGVIGTDADGDSMRAACLARALPTEFLTVLPGVPSAHTHVMNVPGRSRTFFYNGGACDRMDERHVDVEALDRRGARIFYLGYLTLLPALSRLRAEGVSGAAMLLADLVSRGIETCVDLVSIEVPDYAREVQAILPVTDVLLLNEIEAARATGTSIDPMDLRPGMARAAEMLLAGGVRRAVIMHTPHLVLWKSRDLELWTQPDPVPPEEIISPVGAGDAFAAGCLHGLHEGWSPEDMLGLALRAAAASLRGVGASDAIPRLAELLAPMPRPQMSVLQA